MGTGMEREIRVLCQNCTTLVRSEQPSEPGHAWGGVVKASGWQRLGQMGPTERCVLRSSVARIG